MCTTFVRRIRLQQNFEQIDLVNARNDRDTAQHYRQKGMSLDDGMVVVVGESEYYGADAVNALALMSSSSDLFNRINATLFGNAALSRALYPVLKLGRAILLKVFGRGKIDK